MQNASLNFGKAGPGSRVLDRNEPIVITIMIIIYVRTGYLCKDSLGSELLSVPL